MKADTLLAGLNDTQKLNDKQVAEILLDIFIRHRSFEIEPDVLKDAVRTYEVKQSGDIELTARSMISQIEKIDFSYYRDYLSELQSQSVQIVTIFDPEYPENLWKIDDPPLVLYINGNFDHFENCVAVVGTREAKEHRIQYVRKIAAKLVDLGHVVVSGLARGVDTAAHEAALEAGGDTVAVLHSHVDDIHPASNRKLAKQITRNGSLVSEVSPEARMHPGRFVERNRITSGMSDAIIIGASGESGGTIHQARFAQQQGLPRFLYDPHIRDGQSPPKLERMGYRKFRSIDELEDLLDGGLEEFDERGPVPKTLNDFVNA